jgi:hypothetical protein
MKDLKYQFDPDSLLSCDRFIQWTHSVL